MGRSVLAGTPRHQTRSPLKPMVFGRVHAPCSSFQWGTPQLSWRSRLPRSLLRLLPRGHQVVSALLHAIHFLQPAGSTGSTGSAEVPQRVAGGWRSDRFREGVLRSAEYLLDARGGRGLLRMLRMDRAEQPGDRPAALAQDRSIYTSKQASE